MSRGSIIYTACTLDPFIFENTCCLVHCMAGVIYELAHQSGTLQVPPARLYQHYIMDVDQVLDGLRLAYFISIAP